MTSTATLNLILFGPELCLMIAGLCSLVLGAWPSTRRWCALVVGAGLAAAAVNLWGLGGIPVMTLFYGMLRLQETAVAQLLALVRGPLL